MCGIVGIMSNERKGCLSREKYFNNALFADALRGMDSTGVFVAEKDGDVSYFKKAVNSLDFMNMQYYPQFSRKYDNAAFVVGHNRKATKGAVNNMTAHPFYYNDIILVHNGTLNNHRTFPEGSSFDIDSEALTWAVASIGAKKAFEMARGSFACVWYDQSQKALRMVRNSERPLHYVKCVNQDAILFASEPAMLLWCAHRNDIQLGSIKPLPEGVIYSFDPENLDEPTKEKITLQTFSYTANPKRKGGNHATNPTNRQLPGPTTVKTPPATTKQQAANTQHDTNKNARQYKKALSKADRRLKQHGLERGGDIIFESLDFIPNAGSVAGTGRLIGIYGDGKTACEVVDHGTYDGNFVKDASYEAEVLSIKIADAADLSMDTIIVQRASPLKIVTSTKEVDKSEVGKRFDPRYKGPGGIYITKEEWLEQVEDGCAFCTGNVSLEYHEKAEFLDKATGGGVLCHLCAEDYNKGKILPHQISRIFH